MHFVYFETALPLLFNAPIRYRVQLDPSAPGISTERRGDFYGDSHTSRMSAFLNVSESENKTFEYVVTQERSGWYKLSDSSQAQCSHIDRPTPSASRAFRSSSEAV